MPAYPQAMATAAVLQPQTKFGFTQYETVTWKRANVEVPAGSKGEIQGFGDGDVYVKFPNAYLSFQPTDLVKAGEPCRFFKLASGCRYGDKCRYSHISDGALFKPAEPKKFSEQPTTVAESQPANGEPCRYSHIEGFERYLGSPLSSPGYQDSTSSVQVGRPDWKHLAEFLHEPERWRTEFAAAGDGTQNPNMFMIKGLRKLIWLQTEKVVGRALQKPCSLVPNPAPQTKVIDGKTAGGATGSIREPKDVQVLQRDMVEVAAELAAAGHTVAVLNMAAARTPGGGVKNGDGAQEENLHRRTDMFRFTMKQMENYPIPEDSCLLSKDVTIMRGTEKDGYPFLPVMPRISVLSCAAISHPLLNPERTNYHRQEDYKLMQTKAAAILHAAAQAGCSKVVLSAFGCGAFGNPPKVVAEIFKEAILRSPVNGAVFCIFDDHNARKEHNPEGNFLPFSKVFQQ